VSPADKIDMLIILTALIVAAVLAILIWNWNY
jgi:hypothetical protein